jgi:hypothetical protein
VRLLLAWLVIGALIALISRGRRPVRPVAWLGPVALVPLTLAMMVAFFITMQ